MINTGFGFFRFQKGIIKKKKIQTFCKKHAYVTNLKRVSARLAEGREESVLEFEF